MSVTQIRSTAVQIRAGAALIEGDLTVPDRPRGLVVFAHGSGSSRFSQRNRSVADVLVRGDFATLVLDLLTRQEDVVDQRTREYRFDIARLGHRVVAAIDWAQSVPALAMLPVVCFGASTGAAAALVAAADRGGRVAAVVSRGGRPDLAAPRLEEVLAPTLLIVGGLDTEVLELNHQAQRRLRCSSELAVVPGATHLFEEPGTLEAVTQLASGWFARHLVA